MEYNPKYTKHGVLSQVNRKTVDQHVCIFGVGRRRETVELEDNMGRRIRSIMSTIRIHVYCT